MVGLGLLALAEPGFTLTWEHSVEHIAWQEDWEIMPDGLVLRTARVRGSGAGMEPGDDAVLLDGWWQWHPDLAVPSLTLAASGATSGGWTLCSGSDTGPGTCNTLGAASGPPLTLAPCP